MADGVGRIECHVFLGYFSPVRRRHVPEENILHRLAVFENRVQRRIFGPERDGKKGGRRKGNNGDLHDLNCKGRINRTIRSWRMKFAGHVARVENKLKARILKFLILQIIRSVSNGFTSCKVLCYQSNAATVKYRGDS
jgi:hypothetical protein